MKIYISGSIGNMPLIQELTATLADAGHDMLDWTKEELPPQDASLHERTIWRASRKGRWLFRKRVLSCSRAELVIYLGNGEQDSGVEVGIAYALGIPVLALFGAEEEPGLMLHNAKFAEMTPDFLMEWRNNLPEMLIGLKTILMPNGLRLPQELEFAELRDKETTYAF